MDLGERVAATGGGGAIDLEAPLRTALSEHPELAAWTRASSRRPLVTHAIPSRRTDRRHFVVHAGDSPVAIVTASERHGAFAAQLTVHRVAAAGEIGRTLRVPRLIAHLERGWCSEHPAVECVIDEYLPGIGDTPIDSSRVSAVLDGLCDLYTVTSEGCSLAEDVPEPVRPEAGALDRLLQSDPEPAARGPYGGASHRLLRRIAAREVDLLDRLRSDGLALIHGDLWYRNAGFTDRGFALVDWEHAHRGNPGADLAHLWLMTPGLLASVGSGYAAVDELAARVRRRLGPAAFTGGLIDSWRRGFEAHLLLEGVRTLWGPLRRSLSSPRPTLTGESNVVDKMNAAQRLSAALRELDRTATGPR